MIEDTTIKKGYKQTELGVIPEDWDILSLSEITSEIGDGIHTTPIYSPNGEYFFINGNNIRNGQIVITEDTKTVDISEFKKHKKDLGDRTILLSINGTIGNLALFNGEKVVLGKSAANISTRIGVEKSYIYYSLQTNHTKLQFNNGLTGTTIKNLGLSTIRSTQVPLPSQRTEQSAIATVLSDTDALINQLDKLIAKKKDIKQGAMQQLLTGKKRLPGFNKEWKIYRLGDIADTLKGKMLSKGVVATLGSRKCILYGELFTTYQRIIKNVVSRTDSNDGISSKYGDVLMPGSTTTVGADLAIASALLEENILLGGDINIIRKKTERFIPEFLAYHLTQVGMTLISGITQGITIIHLYGKDLMKLEIVIPVDLVEQKAIVEIITNMDEEIIILMQKRDKYKMLKQGMIQQLLTGKIRLL